MSSATSSTLSTFDNASTLKLLTEVTDPASLSKDTSSGNGLVIQPIIKSSKLKAENIEALEESTEFGKKYQLLFDFTKRAVDSLDTPFPLRDLYTNLLPAISEDQLIVIENLSPQIRYIIYSTIIARNAEKAKTSASIAAALRTTIVKLNSQLRTEGSQVTKNSTQQANLEKAYEVAKQFVKAHPKPTTKKDKATTVTARATITSMEDLVDDAYVRKLEIEELETNKARRQKLLDQLNAVMQNSRNGMKNFIDVAKVTKAALRQEKGKAREQQLEEQATHELATRNDPSTWVLPKPGSRRNTAGVVIKTDPFLNSKTLLQRFLMPHLPREQIDTQKFVQFLDAEADQKLSEMRDNEGSLEPHDDFPVNFVLFGFSDRHGGNVLDEEYDGYIPAEDVKDIIRQIPWNLSLEEGDNTYEMIYDKTSDLYKIVLRSEDNQQYLWRHLEQRVLCFQGVYFGIKGTYNRETDMVSRHMWATQTYVAKNKFTPLDFPLNVQNDFLANHKIAMLINPQRLDCNWFDAICLTVTGLDMFLKHAVDLDKIKRAPKNKCALQVSKITNSTDTVTIGNKEVESQELGPYRLILKRLQRLSDPRCYTSHQKSGHYYSRCATVYGFSLPECMDLRFCYRE